MIPALLGKSKIKMADLGLDDIAEEFRDKTKTAAVLKKTFELTGFTAMDRIGKELTVNAAIERHQEKRWIRPRLTVNNSRRSSGMKRISC